MPTTDELNEILVESAKLSEFIEVGRVQSQRITVCRPSVAAASASNYVGRRRDESRALSD